MSAAALGPRDGFFRDAAERAARREPFVTATVVRAERPTSAKPGAKAIVTADGRLRGWIGGSCAAPVVVREALGALAEREPRLILISNGAGPGRPGVRHFPMTCHSGGALEIYIEPVIPSEQLVVVGRTPVARALVALGAALGMRAVAAEADVTLDDFPGAAAVVPSLARAGIDERAAIVVATRGDHDEDAVIEALRTPARYVALVASRHRGDVLVDAVRGSGLTEESLARLRYPAGLDIGARSEEEIALSILAEIVAKRASTEARAATAPAEAIDPICGMTVAIVPGAISAEHAGATYYFCAEGCRRTFLRDPAAALAS